MSSVPDAQSGEVGGLQNTVTNLGASIGTALAGAVLISALTTSFLAGIENSAAVSDELAAQAQVELSAGIPFISDNDLESVLADAGVPPQTADAIADDYPQRDSTASARRCRYWPSSPRSRCPSPAESRQRNQAARQTPHQGTRSPPMSRSRAQNHAVAPMPCGAVATSG